MDIKTLALAAIIIALHWGLTQRRLRATEIRSSAAFQTNTDQCTFKQLMDTARRLDEKADNLCIVELVLLVWFLVRLCQG